MLNSIITQDQDGQKLFCAISSFSKIEILNSTLKSSDGIYFCKSGVYLCISWWYDLPVLLTAVEGEYHEQIYTRKPETSYP